MKFDLKNFSLAEFLRYFVVGLNFIVFSLLLPLLITSNISWGSVAGKNSIGIVIVSIMAGYLIDSLKLYQLSWLNIIKMFKEFSLPNKDSKHLSIKKRITAKFLVYEKTKQSFIDEFCSIVYSDISKINTSHDRVKKKKILNKEEKSLLFSLAKRFAREIKYNEIEYRQSSWILNNHSCKILIISSISWLVISINSIINLTPDQRIYLFSMSVIYMLIAIRFDTVSSQEKIKSDTAFLNFAKIHCDELKSLISKKDNVDPYMPTVSAGGIVVGVDHKFRTCIAMVQRKKDNQWVFPKGGKKQEDKSVMETAKREIKEETSIKEEIYQFIEPLKAQVFFDEESNNEKMVKLFLGKIIIDNLPILTTDSKHNCAQWVKLEDINPKMMHYPYQMEIIETYKNKIKNLIPK